MQASGSLKVILAALIGNGLIALTKGAAAVYTGSAAMMSEAIHSLVDTGNQGLLLLGIKRAARPPDEKHPFGYGGEVYFWAFVVAILIFAVGAGVSLYEGWHKLHHPEPVRHVYINYIVLCIAIVFEGWAWMIAFREFNKQRGDADYLTAVRTSKDPSVFTVLFEDTAAMLGLIVALVGIALSHTMDWPWMDGAASMLIGVILALVAAFLAYECKGLLIGEGAAPHVVAAIREILKEHAGNVSLNEMLTIHFGPEDVLVTISLDFRNQMNAEEVEQTVTVVEQRIKAQFPTVSRIFIEAQGRREHAAGGDA